MVILYFAVSVVICGFLAAAAAAMGLKHRSDVPMGGAEWAPQGIGKMYRAVTDRCGDIPDCFIEYVSAYNPEQTVKFSDPADGYEYVVNAVRCKNKALDRMENQVLLGYEGNYEYLIIDMHRERDYWLAELHEYRED
jgi:hypothetical protein